MKVFRIPLWDNESGVTHIATSWKLTSDIEGKNVITQTLDSTKYLDYWAVNVVVPKNKVYYVWAKRKFKEVDNDTWIGPKKVLNDNSGVSEILKPEIKIDAPYISNINLDYENGLTIELTPYKGTVPHIATSWIIKNTKTGELIINRLHDTNNLTELKIKPSQIDFSNISHITVMTLYHGKLGAESNPTVEIVELSNKYFEIEANKKIAPSDIDYEGSIKQITPRPVTLKTAELFDITGKKICDGTVHDNNFRFASSCLKPMRTYYVKLGMILDNDNSTLFKTTYSFFTKSVTEKIIFDTERRYNNKFSILLKDTSLIVDKLDNNLKVNGIRDSIQMLTEETYVGIIPIIANDGSLKAYFYSKNDHKLYYSKNIGGFIKNVKNYVKAELTPDNHLYIDTVVTIRDSKTNKNYDVRRIYIYKFDPYTLNLTLIRWLDRKDEFVVDVNSNSYGVLNGEFYWAAINKNDRSKLIIRKINKDTLTINTIYDNRFDPNNNNHASNVLFTRTLEDRFIIAPVCYTNGNVFDGYVFDISKQDYYQLFSIPSEVRTKRVLVNSLDNGDILISRIKLDNSKLYYSIINGVDLDKVITKYQSPVIDSNVVLRNSIRLKSGNVLQYGFNANRNALLLWD